MSGKEDWGRRRVKERKTRKPYNDDYRETDRRRPSRRIEDFDEEDFLREDETGGRYDDEPYGAQKGRKKHGALKAVLWVFLALFMLAAAVCLAVAAIIGSLWSHTGKSDFAAADVAVNQDMAETVHSSLKDYRTILICGVDSRENTAPKSGSPAESNVLVAVHKKTGAVKLLTVCRDTFVEAPDGRTMRLSEVFEQHGMRKQLETINRNFDLEVTEYVTLNGKALAQAISFLGGIDLDLGTEECKSINRYLEDVMQAIGFASTRLSVADGIQHVDGVQAVTYCRQQNVPGNDYQRTERQRIVLAGTLAKAGKAGPVKIMQICSRVFPGISTSLSLPEVLVLLMGTRNYTVRDSAGFPFEYAEKTEEDGEGTIYPETLIHNAAEMHAYLYGNSGYTPSGTVTEISRRIEDACRK